MYRVVMLLWSIFSPKNYGARFTGDVIVITLRAYSISLKQRAYLPSVHSLMCFFLYIDYDRAIDFFSHWYSERNMRMIQIQDNISEQKNLKDKLESEQEKLHVEYNKVSSRNLQKIGLFLGMGWLMTFACRVL